ncbi:pentatricopeptide repeat domain-containing protein [Spizellomyces punctatus DAOM BR117]|uniref:Pentatricopeptide repeat domain-containing protein n=1 Tax=Spizellomyces punctatus (strain DAOM BR117) TaxID=645134 RepID=A0A0L0HW96_SPIPD|nr:pentatricopeptide repeat domain-containing protein [Spizellomyces punctatus DAOM BR117]KND05154.1 pentatricopeptide repeat domain-containing protein [Spizellomyces punctatus DAOM BR117]|eukprot:XP_016613193.1 pentatricopeptide repeat domain-containing protein [Spizellomyces punctatus DAOM BR117]
MTLLANLKCLRCLTARLTAPEHLLLKNEQTLRRPLLSHRGFASSANKYQHGERKRGRGHNKQERKVKIFNGSIRPELPERPPEVRYDSRRSGPRQQKTWIPTKTNNDTTNPDHEAELDAWEEGSKVYPPDMPAFEAALKANDRVGAWLKFRDIIVDEGERTKLTIPQLTKLMKLLVQHDPPKTEFMYQVFGMMKQLGLSPTTQTFNLLMRAHAQEGKVAEARRVLTELVAAGLQPDMHTYNLFMKMYIESDNLNAAVKFFNRMVEEGVAPDVMSYNTLISGFAAADQPEMAWKYYEEMTDLGYEPNAVTYTHLIKMHTAHQDMEAAERWFAELKQRKIAPDSFIYSALMGGYARLGDNERVKELFREMVDAGLAPDRHIYTIALHAKTKVGDVEGAIQDIREMIKVQIQPDSVTYQSLASALCSAGRILDAENLLIEMRRNGNQIFPSIYRTIIEAYANAGQVEDAARVLEQMQLDGTPVNVAMLNVVLEAAARTFNTEVMETYWDKLRLGIAPGVKPNARSYGIVLEGYIVVNDAVAATRIFNEMIQANIEPEPKISVALINANVRSRRLVPAVSVLSRMRRSAKSDVHSVGQAFIEHRDEFEKLMMTLGQEIEKSRVSAEKKLDVSPVERKEALHKCDLVIALYEVLTSGDVAPPEQAYRYAMDAHRRKGDPINTVRIFTDLHRLKEESVIDITAPTVTLLLRTALEFKLDKVAREAVKLVENAKLPLDKDGYAAVLQLLARSGMTSKIMSTMLDMVNAGYPLDGVLYSKIVRALRETRSVATGEQKKSLRNVEGTLGKFVEEHFPELLEDVEKEELEFRQSLLP